MRVCSRTVKATQRGTVLRRSNVLGQRQTALTRGLSLLHAGHPQRRVYITRLQARRNAVSNATELTIRLISSGLIPNPNVSEIQSLILKNVQACRLMLHGGEKLKNTEHLLIIK